MAFPPGFLDELRARVPLGELVGRRVRLVRRGREQAGLCPFHNEKTPSFYVVEDKGFFHCFGCGAHGDAIGFLMRADNLDFIEAVERLAGEAGIAVPQQTPQDRERAQRQKTLLEALAAAADFYEVQLWSSSGARAREYLTARGLDEETVRRFRLGWAGDDRQALRRALAPEFPEPLLHEAGLLRTPEDGGNPYDYFRGRVMFPIGDRAGRVIAFGARTLGDDPPKYLNSPDTPVFEKGRVLYAWAAARAGLARQDLRDANLADGAAAAIVVEGYMDVIALYRAGFETAVAPLGTALTEMQLAELWRLSPEPVLCFDGDTAGQRAALRALDRALPLLQPGRSLRFACLPPGEDPDSLIRGAGRPAVGSDRGSRRGAVPSALEREGPPPPLPGSPGRRNREVFLAVFVRWPGMIEEWIEEIAAIDVPEPELDSLRGAILEIAHAHPGLDAGAFQQHLANCGHAEILSALTLTVARHAGFAARGGDDPEVIRLGLGETLQLLRAQHPSDREAAYRAFGADASDENWQRLKALKDREAQDGPVGGYG